MTNQRKALLWHRGEAVLVAGLLAYVILGWIWSEGHNRPRFVATKAHA